MRKLITRISTIKLPDYFDLIFIFITNILAYGIVLPKLGYYWDDWAFLWIANHLGHIGIAQYFFDRSVYGIFVNFTTSFLGTKPVIWQVFNFLTHYTSAIILYWLIRLIWPSEKKYALWGGLLFLIFPGFMMQSIAINIGHFFLFASFFLLSFCFNVLAIHKGKGGWVFTILALVFSFLNLSAWEYFFTLELIRPFLIAFVLGHENISRKDFWRKWIFAWLPYLALLILLVLWRTLLLPEQTSRYQLVFFESLKTNPFPTMINYLEIFGKGINTAFLIGWAQIFDFPEIKIFGTANFIRYCLVMAIALALGSAYVLRSRYLSIQRDKSASGTYFQFVSLGLIWLLLAGIPFVLINNPVGMNFPNNRFIVPFIPGAVFLLIGLLGMLSFLKPFLHVVSQISLIIVAALSVGQQFKNGMNYIADWKFQQRLFWQFSWRVPALTPGTAIISNDFIFRYESDNSITGPVNWMYAPDYKGGDLPYDFLFVDLRLHTYLSELMPNRLISQPYRPVNFIGNTSQTISIYYQPPGCVRLLDPDLDPNNPRTDPLLRQAASLSTLDRIIPEGNPYLPADLFGDEPTHNWCYYFEKADLARQEGNWMEVVQLGEKAFSQSDLASDPMELVPFIEGYAHTDNWSRALELTQNASAFSTPEEPFRPVLCLLWQRIANQTVSSDARMIAFQQISQSFSCELP